MRLKILPLAASLAALAVPPALAQSYSPPPYSPPAYPAPTYSPPGYPPTPYYAPPPAGYPPAANGSAPLPSYTPTPGRSGATPLYPPGYAGPPPATYPAPPPAYAAPAAPPYSPPPVPPPAAGEAAGLPLGARPGYDARAGSSTPYSTRASNIDRADTRATIAPSLPTPRLGPDAAPLQYLEAARGALAAGRTGQAQQSLEMAQTRLLDRSVTYDATNRPIADPAVAQISDALRALASRDRFRAMQIIDATLPLVAAQTGAPR